MKIKKEHMLLYAVTDRTWLQGQSLYDAVEEVLKAEQLWCSFGKNT